MIQASTELFRFLDRRSMAFSRAMIELANAYRTDKWEGKIKQLAELIRETMTLADLHGRKRMLMEADLVRRVGRKRGGHFAAIPTPGEDLPFMEAVEDILDREPRLAKSAAEVARLYNTSKTFAMAKSCSYRLTERVQGIMGNLMREGVGVDAGQEKVLEVAKEEAHDWSRAYAETVYRTNVNNSYTEGRFAQAKDPDVAEVVPALEFYSVMLPTSRPNHVAAHGLLAATSDPVWATFKPPIGYNCFCGANFVSVYELERRGLLQGGRVMRYEPPTFKSAYPDPGFGRGGF